MIEPLLAAAAVALVITGATAALLLTNAVKRVAGIIVAGFGATLALAALGAPDGALVASVAIVFTQAVIGVVVIVRLQESYGAVEAPEIDSSDRNDEAREDEP
ncbi:MAG: hypothetical protein R3C30_07240 [Hyphomonadaceae bacterium]